MSVKAKTQEGFDVARTVTNPKNLQTGAIVIGLGLAAYLVWKSGLFQTAFKGLSDLSGGISNGLKTLTSGQIGASFGTTQAQKPEVPGVQLAQSPTGLLYNTNFQPISSDNPTGWNPEWATGYQPASGLISIGPWDIVRNPTAGVATVNVPVTDASFAKIGLTTAQVEQLQMRYPSDVNVIVMALKNGTPLTDQQEQELASVGVTVSGGQVTIPNWNSGTPLSEYTSGEGPLATGVF